MGVSGVGKTTLGRMLAEELSLPFYDADDFHSAENRKKMQAGISLQDEDRKPWLESISESIQKWSNENGAVLACSALKEKYRSWLSGTSELRWIYLFEEYETIASRIKKRKSHFFDPELLKSQFDTLEPPEYGIHIRVDGEPNNSLEKIIEKIRNPRIGLIGLGVMGKSLALNIAGKGFPVSVYNRQEGEKEQDIARNFAKSNAGKYDIPAYDNLKEFISKLESPRNIMIMVKAGEAVDQVIDKLIPLLEKGDLIIDGGNSHFKDTDRRSKLLQQNGIEFIGAGISGGEEGALKGPSIMPGGSKKAYDRVSHVLESISAKDKHGNPCCSYIGSGSSDHYIKMVHNGIEYAEMQLIAEFYYFMRFFQKRPPESISEVFSKWNHTEKSYLLEITAHILKKKENDDFLIDKILDVAGQKGTGGWTTNSALELGVSLDTITASVMARNISGLKNEKKKAEKLYGEWNYEIDNISLEELFSAYKAGSIINHTIGFELLRMASKEYDWKLDLSEISRIWTNGCIIRSSFMEELVQIIDPENTEHLLLNPKIVALLKQHSEKFKTVISKILDTGCPMQVSSAALNYFLNFIRGNTSANIIQAQRDYFGAHTYERTDKPRGQFFHTTWKTL